MTNGHPPRETGRLRDNQGRDSGLTLAEMIVALGIVTLVVIAAVASFGVMLGAQRDAETVDQVAQLTRDRLETTRLVPYDQLGFEASTPDYRAAYRAETTVQVQAAAPAVPPPLQQVTVGRHDYTVRTDITWAIVPTVGTAPAVTTVSQSLKRITVTWLQDGTQETFQSQTLRAQSATDTPVEPGLGPGQATCTGPGASAICSVFVTAGPVLNAPAAGASTATANRALEFRATLDVVPSSVRVTFGAQTLNLGPTGDGTTWLLSRPSGQVTPIGANVVTFTARVAGVDQSVSVAVRWSYPDTTPVSLTPASGGSTWLTGSFYDYLSPDLSRFRGDETQSTRAYFCASSSTGELFRDAAFMFDTTGIKDSDGPYVPEVTYESTAPGSTLGTPVLAQLDAEYIGRPELSTAAAGSTRWYVILPHGTTFHYTSTQLSTTQLTFSVTRPQDGLPVAVVVSVPVQYRPNAASCG